MHVGFFDWDEADFAPGNTRHILSAGFAPETIERVIRDYRGPLEVIRKTGRPMIRATLPDCEEILVVFEIEGDADFLVVRPVTAFPREV